MDGLQRLRDIRRLKGALDEPASAPAIMAHLREILDNADAASAGFSLRGVSAAQWNGHGRDWVAPLRVGLVSNFVCGEFDNQLRFHFLRERMHAEIYAADFDQYVPELIDAQSGLHRFAPDLTVCLLDEHVLTDRLQPDWLVDEMEACLRAQTDALRGLFAGHAQRCSGLLVLNTIALASVTYAGIIDYRSKARLSRAWRELNIGLLSLAVEHNNIVVIDSETLLQKGAVALRDARMAGHAKMYMDESLLAELALEVRKVAQSIAGKTKKCLVLDCDNTLWGGIVGDDGLDGIALGGSPEGEAYVAFQRVVKRLRKQGVLLALNSKNDKLNTDKVFDSHPDTQLRQQDFVAQCVNWEPKHDNFGAIARRVNIGTAQMVFIDDSHFECALVKGMLPEVTVIQLGTEACEHIDALLAGGWFNTLALTSEDFNRAEQYQIDAERANARATYDSYDDYLRGLAISVELFEPDAWSLPRVAQLTQRTNQFNLSTWRLSEEEVRQLLADGRHTVVAIRAGDRFGDNGIVGAIFVERVALADGALGFVIKNFLLSCRVFSRGIEACALREMLLWARAQGAQQVLGEFILSPKNGQFAHFFLSNGFAALEEGAEGRSVYRHGLLEIGSAVGWIDVNSHFLEVNSVCT